MQRGAEQEGSRSHPLRLRKRRLSSPILSLGTQEAEHIIRQDRITLIRRLRRELRMIARERKQTERRILADHPLMECHPDRRHIFYGTDLDQQFSS